MQTNRTLAESFCIELLSILPCGKALTNLVMALASYCPAKSVVELSLSPLYHYQFSSISKVVSALACSSADYDKLQAEIQCLVYNHFESKDSVLLVTDSMPLHKPHSPTLEDRCYVYRPNELLNRFGAGFYISFVNLLSQEDNWNIPFDVCRLAPQDTGCSMAVKQITHLLTDPKLGLKDKPVKNLLDSGYGNASYICPTYRFENLTNIVRFQAGIKVYTQAEPDSRKTYGKKCYLIAASDIKTYHRKGEPYQVERTSVFELDHHTCVSFKEFTKNGRETLVELTRWNDLLIRSKNGHNMKDKPFDLVAVKVSDAKTGKSLFARPYMFIAITGKNKADTLTKQAYLEYRKRYAIEAENRFNKQHLLVDSFQTPCVQNLDNWMLVVMLTNLLLYLCASQADYQPVKWRKYETDQHNHPNSGRLSPTKTRRAAESLFLTFDKQPFLPQKSKSGKGREKGTKLVKRTHHKPIKKGKKAKIKKKATQNSE